MSPRARTFWDTTARDWLRLKYSKRQFPFSPGGAKFTDAPIHRNTVPSNKFRNPILFTKTFYPTFATISSACRCGYSPTCAVWLLDRKIRWLKKIARLVLICVIGVPSGARAPICDFIRGRARSLLHGRHCYQLSTSSSSFRGRCSTLALVCDRSLNSFPTVATTPLPQAR